MNQQAEQAAAVAERTARTSYGRLVALLAASSGDLELAEDMLAHAFERALGTWSRNGVPSNPEGWLLTVARNGQRDEWKSAQHRRNRPLDPASSYDEVAGSGFDELDPDEIPDRRLALLFVCAHPAIAPNVRTPLMLQTVLGFDSAQIARAFVTSPAAMRQRLVRAKRRIHQARIPFEVPGRSAMPDRLPSVLEAVYGCYALTWHDDEGEESLAGEARYLATTLATQLGDEPEAWSLAATLLLASARGGSSAGSSAGAYVPLDEQDPSGWDRALITEGESCLRRAERPGRAPGRFQLEAAIQAVHCDRIRGGDTDWSALATLYAALVAVAPSLGSRVAQAAVVCRTESPMAALHLLEALPPEREQFQPYHATRADVLALAGRNEEAAAAYCAAGELADDAAVAAFLAERARRVRLMSAGATR